MRVFLSWALRAALILAALASGDLCRISAQVIEFETGGLKYQSLTRGGVTIMCARLSTHLKEYSMIQVAVTNGSDSYATISPENFAYSRTDGHLIRAASANTVVEGVMEHGDHSDLVKLVTTYENAIYGIPNMKVMNGYEKRRQAALGEGSSARFKAAAAASAIALTPSRVPPGQSTDGAVFFPTGGKVFPPGHIVVKTATQTWDFNPE